MKTVNHYISRRGPGAAGAGRLILALLIVLSGISPVAAKMYRGFDAEGNVIYSDTPFEDAERYSPPPISVVDTPKAEQAAAAADKKTESDGDKPFRYMDFDITSPTFNQSLQNPEYVTVTLRLNPALNTEKQHTIWLLLDGKAVVRNSRETSLRLEQVHRGAHELQAQVRDASGKVVARSRPVIFFVHRSSVR